MLVLIKIFIFLIAYNENNLSKKEIYAIKDTKNIYNYGNLIGKNVEINYYKGEGFITVIYLSRDNLIYIKLSLKGINETKRKMKDIIKKYKNEEEKNPEDKLNRELVKEIELLFKDKLIDLEIFDGEKSQNYSIGFENSHIFILAKDGKKLFNEDMFNYLYSNYPDNIKELINLWRCNNFEGAYFSFKETKNINCKNFEYKEEYIPCDYA